MDGYSHGSPLIGETSFFGGTRSGKEKEGLSWEYLYFTDAEKETRTLYPPAHKEKLNELGNEGWELVSVVFDQTGKVKKLYLKRAIGS